MIQAIFFFGGLTALGIIFARRYLAQEKNTTLGAALFRKKNLFRRALESSSFELTVDEIIPPRDETDSKKLAKADSLLKKADIFANRGDIKSAEQFLIQALALDPSAIDAYRHLGMIYLKQSQFGKAESIYRKLVATVTDDPVFYSNLGMALFSQKKLDEAKTYYQKAIELDETRPARFFSLAQILYELEDFEAALKYFRKAAEMDPENADYLLTLAHFYINREMIPDAKQLLSEILLAFPENEEAQGMLQKL